MNMETSLRAPISCAALLFAALSSTQALAVDLPGPLVDTQWLQNNRATVRVLDVRGDMQSYSKDGHIPAAAFVPFMKVRANAEENGVVLQDMNLSKEGFEALMRSVGVNNGDMVVIAHRGTTLADLGFGTYLYWQMKYYGHDTVALLEGGTAKWAQEKREIQTAVDEVKPGNFTVGKIRSELLATTAQVKQAMDVRSADLLDARPMSQVLGFEKRDYVAAYGYIPGSKLLPFDALVLMGKGMVFWSKDALSRGVAAAGLGPNRPIITYCNTGHVSAVDWFVLHELLGFRQVALYDGSMHAWAKQRLPVTTMLR